MINNKNNPVEWSTLLCELGYATEHLEALVKNMNKDGCIDVVEYEVQLGHVFAHLNSSWNSRKIKGKYTDETRDIISDFPTDLKPCG